MEKILARMTDLLEHLVFSHTFRSEFAHRRATSLLGEIRAELRRLTGAAPAPAAAAAAAAGPEAPASTPETPETADDSQPGSAGDAAG